jgi:hypothetical protein
MKPEKSVSFSDLEHNKENAGSKIELLTCQEGGKRCKDHLVLINQKYSIAHELLSEKDYMNSIKALKDAFYISSELRETSCLKCAELFRSTITQSLENINLELQALTSGFLKKKRYIPSYIESCNVLEELKKIG